MRVSIVWCSVLAACGFDGAPVTPGDGDGDGDGDGNGVPDAPGGDALADAPDGFVCPAEYVDGVRAIATLQPWLAGEADCEDDAPGLTHLAVVNDEPERVALAAIVMGMPGDAAIGLVRDPGGASPWSWRYVTGEAATFLPFEASEPNNVTGDQLVVVLRRSSGHLYDFGVDNPLYALCECDGRPAVNADYDPSTSRTTPE